MAQKEYDQFKAEIKEWLDNNPDEYDRFVAELNDKSSTGLLKIFKLGLKTAPQLMKRYKSACHGDIVEEQRLQSCTADADTARMLIDEFHKVKKDSVVPAMLAWLYFGQSYETMVIQLENEMHNPTNNFIEKKIAAITIKLVINSSIRNKMRTKVDWENFHRQKKSIEENRVAEECIAVLETARTTEKETMPEEGQSPRTLRDYFLHDKDMLLERIKSRVLTRHTGADLARLYLALQEEGVLDECDVTTFHRLLSQELPDCDMKSVRNLQISIKKLNDTTIRGRIKDFGVERANIDEWRAYLMNLPAHSMNADIH
ncbi:MAG: DUF6043 family protein [Prevotella sp.]|nr:DUF6043 family protein [Prevotella sp.]